MSDLLATKITLPPSSRERIDRARLTGLIEEGLSANRRVILVSAPAGFGKTTCVLAWLEASGRKPVSWLSLEEADDDAIRFFLYLIASLQKNAPELGRRLEGLLRAGQLPPVEALCAALINEIQELKEEIILVLDDFHVLQAPYILEVIERLVANLPAPLTLVLAGREDPSFSLARLRASALLTEIRAEDLRFNAAEARVFLSEAMHLTLSPQEVDVLEERTEGWPVGLQLAGLSLRGQADPSAFIAALSGSQRFILNYLVEEVLDRQPRDVQEFLLNLSILERFNAGLCETVTERRDSRALLERVMQANLFLVPLDEKQEWFRYHHLFGELLRDRLASAGPERTADLHRRAGEWFLESGQPLEAIDHALRAGDYLRAVQLLESHTIELLFQGQFGRVEGFLRAIPIHLRGKSMRASLAFAWLYMLRGNIEKAVFYYQQLLGLLSGEGENKPALSPALQAEWLALQAMLAGGQGQAGDSLKLANQALQIVPRDDAYVLALIHMSLASAYQMLDDQPRAVDAYRQIIHFGRLTENFDAEMMGYAGLSQILLIRGLYRSGFEIVSQGLNRVEESGLLPPITAALYGSLGEIYYEWNEPEKAMDYYRRAAELSSLCGYSDGEICLKAILSQQRLTAGDLPGAETENQKGLELMRRLAPAWVREVTLAQQVRVKLAAGKLSEAEAAYSEMAPGTSTSFQLPAFPAGQKMSSAIGYRYESALRIALFRAEKYSEKEGLPAAVDLAGQVITAACQGQFTLFAIETLLLRAHLHLLQGDPDAARTDVLDALRMGGPEGFLRTYLDSDPAVLPVLIDLKDEVLPAGVSPETIERIRQATSMTGAPVQVPFPTAAALLTVRECEVLRLMSAGLKYEEMAAGLVISLNTVRSHVKAIYGKLGVNNRTQAVAWARAHGLLDN